MFRKLDELLEKAKFILTKQEKILYEKDLEKFKKQLLLLDNFNLSEVKPLRQPFERVEDFLREDVPEEKDVTGILENASQTKDGYIFLDNKEKK